VRVRTVQVASVRVCYREAGPPDGPPVVLLHGGSSNSATWGRLAAALAAFGHRVIAPDLRGHGASSRTGTYPLAGFRDDVLGVMDALALDEAAVVGHSLGGHVASVIAQRQPGRVARLVLEEPPVPSRGPGDADGLSTRQFLLPALGYLGLRRGFDRKAVLSVVRELRIPDPSWWEGLAAITAPALLISGGPRSHVSPQRLADVARAIRDSQLVTIPAGHRVHSRSPERFQAAVMPFLTAGEGATPGG
jgi:pimeloyl-ACP methyl ester carboxylesterase